MHRLSPHRVRRTNGRNRKADHGELLDGDGVVAELLEMDPEPAYH